MKGLLRGVIINAVALFATGLTAQGMKISGGIEVFIFGGLALSLMSIFIKPVLSILTLPFNFATMGAFSFITNAILLYLLTLFVPQIQVVPFIFTGVNLSGFVIPAISFNLFFAYIVCAFIISFITSAINWLIK